MISGFGSSAFIFFEQASRPGAAYCPGLGGVNVFFFEGFSLICFIFLAAINWPALAAYF